MKRSNFYKFLSSVYNSPPTEELVSILYTDDVMNTLSMLDGKIKEYLKGPIEPYSLIVQDFHDLFMVPGEKYCTPYEAVYADKRFIGDTIVGNLLMGPSTVAVQKFFKRVGFEVSKDYKELYDYIGLELEFMALLCEKEENTIDNTPHAISSILKMEMEFVSDHLSKWIPAFTEKLISNAQTNFYKSIGLITNAFIYDEAMYLTDIMAGIEV